MPVPSVPKICSVDGCDGKHRGLGYCNKHYQRVCKYGSPLFTKYIRGDDKERFLSKIEIITETGCWIWMGPAGRTPYGSFYKKTGSGPPHRYSYQIHNGEIQKGLCVLHHCDVPLCVNPKHLFLGTIKDNSVDMVMKGRQNKGEKVNTAKLTSGEVLEIRRRYAEFSGIGVKSLLARQFDTTVSNISYILNRTTWKHLANEQ